tara:strand:- start:1863 stop:2696 length:834 start_codon:yes stop_codon:yes gene_type:complete
MDRDQQNTPNNQPKPLSFAVPTDLIDLPSRGKYYPSNHPLCGVDTIEMRHMTAKEEDLLVSETLIEKGVVIDRLLRALMVDDDIDVDTLLTGDKNALIVAARISGYGAEYKTTLTCPQCSKEQQFEFDLDCGVANGAIDDLETINAQVEGLEATAHGTFLVDLPKCGYTIEVKLLTSGEEKSVEKFHEKKKKAGNQTSTFLTDTLKRMIVGVDNVNERSVIREFVDSMPALDSKYLRGVYKNISPNIDLTQDFSCQYCDFRQALEVPVNVEFFWPRS